MCPVTQMEVLGSLIDNMASPKESIDYRLCRAAKWFRKHQTTLCGKGTPLEKLLAWEATAMSSASFGAGTVPLTKELALHVQSWEQRHARIFLRLKQTPAELESEGGYVLYLQRTAHFVNYVRESTNRPFVLS